MTPSVSRSFGRLKIKVIAEELDGCFWMCMGMDCLKGGWRAAPSGV